MNLGDGIRECGVSWRVFDGCHDIRTGETPVTDDTKIIRFSQPPSIIDPLAKVADVGASQMLRVVLKAEADRSILGSGPIKLALLV